MKRLPSLRNRIFLLTLWSWLLVVSAVRHLRMPDLEEWQWDKFISSSVIVVVIFLVAHNITVIATGKYRREDAPEG